MDIQTSVIGQNDVGLRILKQLIQLPANKDSNIVFSPLSIYMMLSLLSSGTAKSQTLDNLLSFLKSDSVDQLNSSVSELIAFIVGDESSSDGPCVSSAMAVWIYESLPIKSSFQKILETVYNGKLNRVDFVNKVNQVVNDANSWVEKETRGLIPEILSKSNINKFTRLILANALYFKAEWYSPFEDKFTEDYDFRLHNGTSIQVPFMCSREDQVISVFDDFKIASLSYSGWENRCFSMEILLPNALDGLPSLISRVCSEPGFIDNHRPKRYAVEVNEFRIPKFEFSYDFKATDILEELGLTSLFSNRDFGEMVEFPEWKELFISNMFHKAVISIDENGTEAAAVTVCEMMGCCLEIEEVVKIDFVADHPFLFFIRENKTGTLLFIGQVLHPSST